MKPGGSTALMIGAGYVLGRQHKLRAALMMGAAATAGRMAARGAGGGGGQQGGADQAKSSGSGLLGKLGGAGKSAAIGAFARSADRIGDRLTERAASMRQGGSGGDDK
jgi:hypothetical protein